MATNTYSTTANATKTLLGITNDLESTLPITPLYDTNSTLNKLYTVLPAATPTSLNLSHPKLLYFGYGINGKFNVTDGNLSQARLVDARRMNLYQQIPIRCVPYEQDLTAAERSQYRMREVVTISGQQYVFYWLKMLQIGSTSVVYTSADPVTGVQTPYALDYSNLQTATNPPTGQVANSTVGINATVSVTLPLLGSEVAEVVNVLFAGDMRYANLSELGFYTGADTMNTTTGYGNQQIQYTESIMTQLAYHYTFNGEDFSSPTKSINRSFNLGKGNVVLA